MTLGDVIGIRYRNTSMCLYWNPDFRDEVVLLRTTQIVFFMELEVTDVSKVN